MGKRQNAVPLLLKFLFAIVLFSLAYILGVYTASFSYSAAAPPPQQQQQQQQLGCLTPNFSLPPPPLDFEPHHFMNMSMNMMMMLHLRLSQPLRQELKNLSILTLCPGNFTHYCPCHDPSRETLFPTERFFHRERHCPPPNQKPMCLVPPPAGYKSPFPWPKSTSYARFHNVPFKTLTVSKKSQNWVRLQPAAAAHHDRLLVFPGGGTSFPKGVKAYVDEIARVLPLKSGTIRTVLDVGCGILFAIDPRTSFATSLYSFIRSSTDPGYAKQMTS